MSSAPGQSNGMSRREELLAVATKLFAARGYHGTRMDDVADAVGLNKATVYHYYASKSLILYDIYKGAADWAAPAFCATAAPPCTLIGIGSLCRVTYCSFTGSK